jgi:hypothetical protein
VRHLSVRAQHVKLHGLIGKRLTVTVAQQAVEDHRFTRAIEIARAKHKELLAVARTTGDIKLRQIERRKFEVKQRGLAVFARQNQRGFFVGLKLCVAVASLVASASVCPLSFSSVTVTPDCAAPFSRLWVKISRRL